MRKKRTSLTARWQEEKKSVQNVQGLKEKLDAARQELDVAQRRGNLARAGELTYGVIPDLEKKLKAIEENQGSALVNEAVTAENIAGVVSRWTGIPVDKMLEGERDKLLHMEKSLEKRVVGQDAGGARDLQCRAPFARRACRIPIARSVRSCSSGPRAWARPS